MIKVMVVDDSAFMRHIISDMLKSDLEISVVGTASNGIDAVDKLQSLNPDVITMDIEMPDMDGLECLEQIMQIYPRPIVMLSSLTYKGSRATIDALMKGALDFVQKPDSYKNIEDIRNELLKKIKGVAKARINPKRVVKGTEKVMAEINPIVSECPIIAIGSSTGGPKALEYVLSRLPQNFPACILISQHMPEGFTKSLAERFDRTCQIKVMEAYEGAVLENGVAYIAPGGYHMKIKHNNTIELDSGPKVSYVKPSIDVMMKSIATVCGNKTIGIILTGMGRDGADGVKSLKKNNAIIICQDQKSSIVYGMPAAVVNDGNADYVASLGDIPSLLMDLVKLATV